MNGCRLTKVYNIDGQLVIADNVESAVELYRKYYNDSFITIDRIELLYGDYVRTNSSAIAEDIENK